MAVNGADSARVNAVLTTTLDRYAPQISNELARNDGIIAVFGSRGAIKVANGGQRAIETLDKSENLNFGFRSAYSDIPTARMDTRTQAKYAWATYDGTVAINDIDKAMNSGDAKIYDLVEAEITNAKRTMVRQVADALREGSPGASNPESLLTIIQDAAGASQTGSTGELSRTTNAFWRNEYSNDAMDLSSNGGLETLTAFMLQSVAKGNSKMDKPDFGILSGTLYAALAAQAENLRRWSSDSKLAEFGFDNIIVNGATMIPDPSIVAGDLYLVNTDSTFIQVLKTPGMTTISNNSKPQSIPISIRGFQNAYNSLHTASVMYTTFALTSASLQRNGIATNCS